jgi:hypothetical protein
MIQTTLLFKIPYKEICKKLNVTENKLDGPKSTNLLLKRHVLVDLLSSVHHNEESLKPGFWSRLHIAEFHSTNIPLYLLELCAGEKAITTAFKGLEYCRRTSKKKNFSDDPEVMAKRVAFAEGVTWSRLRLQKQMFDDEVWATGGAHTVPYVTVKEDGSDRYSVKNL